MRPQEPRPFAALPGGFAPLGYRDYLLFWVGFLVSNTGRWAEMTAALWLVAEMSDSPILLGGIGLARAVPAILLSPFAGVVADRVDQRRLLLITQSTSMVFSGLIGVLILSGRVELWQIFLQLAIVSCIQPFDVAARQTLFPRLVPRTELSNSVTLTIAAARLAKSIGPALGGIAIAAFGEAVPYLLNALSFLALLFAVAAMHPVPAVRIERGVSFLGELREGFDEVRRTPLISGIMQLEAVFGLLQMNEVMITIVSRDVLGLGPEGLGLLLSAPAIGAVIGVAALVLVGTVRRQGLFALISVVIYAGVMLVVATSSTVPVTFIALAFGGLLDSWVTVTRHSILQMTAPGEMRGRIMANMSVVSAGATPLSQVQSGVLTSLVGASPAIALAAVALASVSGAIAARNPVLWRFENRSEQAA